MRRLAVARPCRNIASQLHCGHRLGMRRSVLALILLVSACAPRPEQPSTQPTPTPVSQPQGGLLIGFTSTQLIAQLGPPALQIREGNSLKIQFRGRSCVLDAYLYAQPGSTAQKVTYIETRLPSGADTNQAACISSLATRS